MFVKRGISLFAMKQNCHQNFEECIICKKKRLVRSFATNRQTVAEVTKIKYRTQNSGTTQRDEGEDYSRKKMIGTYFS